MRIPGACCVWFFLCGSGSRFQFRVRDFRPRTQTVFCGQEFCGFKLTFRFCNFLDVNFILFGSFLPKKFKVFCRRTFLIPENGTYISAPPEMRRNAEISMAAESSHPCGANWHNKSAGKVFLRCCYTISKQLLLLLPNCPPIISYLSYLI